jgi:DNA repair exonuclease SbcCD ATPase subunit
MILFRKIKWKNLLSTGNHYTELQFDKSPNTLIVGSNGAGKSTMLDALCFVLFGKPFRAVNKPLLLNSINNKDCVVEVEFDTGNKHYKIVRGIKPNIFEIWCDGEMINQEAAV